MSSVGSLPRRMTCSELLKMPEDGPRIELYDGEVWEMPSPTPSASRRALMNARALLREYATTRGGRVAIAPLDVVFSEYNVVQPDVLYFVQERVHLVKRRQGDPGIGRISSVEILSPTTKSNDQAGGSCGCSRATRCRSTG